MHFPQLLCTFCHRVATSEFPSALRKQLRCEAGAEAVRHEARNPQAADFLGQILDRYGVVLKLGRIMGITQADGPST
jgi:hypothetical protein